MSGRGGNRYERLAEEDGGGRRRRPRGEGGNAWAWFLGLLALAFLAWAIATTVIAANRVDPPGRFQCGIATGYDGDFCYDVIVVGGGTAGLPAAKRISDDPRVSVLVLEQGTDYGAYDLNILNIGNVFPFISFPDKFPNKYYYQVAGKAEPGANNAADTVYGGRMLGGSSSTNYAYQYRGTEAYWDEFDALVGSPGTFTGASIFQTYEDLEWLNSHGHYANLATRGSGTLPTQTWKVDVQPHANVNGTNTQRMEQFLSTGLGLTDYFDGSYNQPGANVGVFPFYELAYNFNTSNPELRWSSRFAFLDSNVMDQQTYSGVSPRQLHVLQNSTVFKLLTIGTTVVGVQFKGSDNIVRNAYCRQNVIVSAGFQSAAVLQRSGIGPAAVLSNAGVTPVLVNENVGRLNVHAGPQILTYWPNITAGTLNPDGLPYPDLVTAMTENKSPAATPGRRGFVWGGYTLGAPNLMLLLGFNYLPKSYGSSIISSPDPLMQSQIMSGMLTNTDDLTSFRDTIRYIIWGLMNADPSFLPLSIDNATLSSDTLLNTWLRANVNPAHHYVGGCHMGTDIATSVVNNRFHVHGITGLRVCDTQIFPFGPDANPSYPAVAMGDICGRMVLEDMGYLSSSSKFPVHRNPARRAPVKQSGTRDEKFAVPPGPRHAPRGNQEIWNAIQDGISYILANYPATEAVQMVNAIKATETYVALCATYCQQ
jgi:choline dehydrogenase